MPEVEGIATQDGRRRLPTAEDGLVYFIRQVGCSRIKVGTAHQERLQARIAELQRFNAERLELLLTCTGGQPFEAEIHQRFAHLRSHGEWFNHDPEIAIYIAALALPSGPSLEQLGVILRGVTLDDLRKWLRREEIRLQQEGRDYERMQLLFYRLCGNPEVKAVVNGGPFSAAVESKDLSKLMTAVGVVESPSRINASGGRIVYRTGGDHGPSMRISLRYRNNGNHYNASDLKLSSQRARDVVGFVEWKDPAFHFRCNGCGVDFTVHWNAGRPLPLYADEPGAPLTAECDACHLAAAPNAEW